MLVVFAPKPYELQLVTPTCCWLLDRRHMQNGCLRLWQGWKDARTSVWAVDRKNEGETSKERLGSIQAMFCFKGGMSRKNLDQEDGNVK